MKRILKIAAPFLFILAVFAGSRINVPSSMTFRDIAGHWAAAEIEKWTARGVISGSGDCFRPDESLTLAELAVIYTRVLPLDGAEPAENTFEDLPEDAWYTEAILRCVGAGIIDAGGKTELAPREPVTRAEAFMSLARALGVQPAEGTAMLRGYNDSKLLTPEQKPYFEALLELGLISGESPVQLWPGDGLSRAETVDMLERMERGKFI